MKKLLILLLLTSFGYCEDLYETLGVSKSANEKEIKKAYVKLAYEWHPDKNKDPDAPKMMTKINHAYEVLSDDDRRRHYDLIGDDSESPRTQSPFSGSSYKPRHRTSQYTSSSEPTDEINAKEFEDQVLPASETVPYLVYFFHDFSIRCEFWTEKLEGMRPDLELIGVKTASINVIISSRVATYSGIYIHEVPMVAIVIERKVRLFKGSLELDGLKDFIYKQLPLSTTKDVVDLDTILSIKTRIKNNKPFVLLVSPRVSPSLNYKMMSFTYQKYLDFYFLSSSSSVTPSNDDLLKELNLTKEAKFFYIYSDLQEPVATLQDDGLTREATKKELDKNKLLTLPRVSSCAILDILCPGGPNTRWCALLVTTDYFDYATDRFRSLASRWNNKKFGMGYLNGYQQSTLMSTVGRSHNSLSVACDNGESSKDILILHRLTSHKLEFDWYRGYCGTDEDSTSLVHLLRRSTLNQSEKLKDCEFGDDIDPDSYWHQLPQWFKDFLTWLEKRLMQYWEKIGAFISLPLPLLLMSFYLFLCPLRQPQHQPRPAAPQETERENENGPGGNVQTGGTFEAQNGPGGNVQTGGTFEAQQQGGSHNNNDNLECEIGAESDEDMPLDGNRTGPSASQENERENENGPGGNVQTGGTFEAQQQGGSHNNNDNLEGDIGAESDEDMPLDGNRTGPSAS